MQKLKMISLLSVAILLTGCSINKINESTQGTGENTGAVSVETGASGLVTTDILSGAQAEVPVASGEIITGTALPEAATTTAAATSTTVAQDNALKAKIKELIEKRKIESKGATGLTEEDIQLMEDVLKSIADTTK